MGFFPIKFESVVVATVTNIITHRISDFDKPPYKQIVLTCNAKYLPTNFEATLTYSAIWAKKNLEIGDTIQFKAKIKKTINHTYEIETLSGKSLDMVDPEEVIEIINVCQIVKI